MIKYFFILTLVFNSQFVIAQIKPKFEILTVDSTIKAHWFEPGNEFTIPFPNLTELNESSDSYFERTKILTGNGLIFQIHSIPVPESLTFEKDTDSLLIKYIDSETAYLGKVIGKPDLQSFINKINLPNDLPTSPKFYVWGFDYPNPEIEIKTDETVKSSAKSSVFIITVRNGFIIGLGTTIFDPEIQNSITDYIIQSFLSME
ncbi:MAG: hypothetical protein LCH54_05980 [Bacteroidetes bacterium]|nr:hypothetical protein [Bacteroidota bacterium]